MPTSKINLLSTILSNPNLVKSKVLNLLYIINSDIALPAAGLCCNP